MSHVASRTVPDPRRSQKRASSSACTCSSQTAGGGTYGVALWPGLFAGESCFIASATHPDCPGLAVDRLRSRGFQLFDIQMVTDHTVGLGATKFPARNICGGCGRRCLEMYD